jgi:plasmid replication initiation protein
MGEVALLKRDIIQANPLIEARKHMNMTEMRLFGLGLSDVTPHITDNHVHDVEFHDTWISYTELVNLFGSNNGGNVANLKRQILKAYQGFIEISKEDGGFKLRHIYEEMEYFPQKGLLIRFHDKLKPYILDLVGKAYTVYKLNLLFLLSSEYSQRLMELLLEKQGYLKSQDKVFRILTIEEVRDKLNIPDGKYEGRINNFRSRVLDIPIKEINEKTDYFVWYEVQKTGRKVTGFKFWLKLKKAAEKVETIEAVPQEKELPAVPAPASVKSDREALKAAMEAEGMPKAAINTWLKRYGVEGAAASWRLAVKHADGRTETHGKGTQRKKYIKACMERNIAAVNENEAAMKAEIDEREKRVAEEKKKAIKEMQEGFEKIGFTYEKRSDLQSTGSIIGMNEEELEPQELSKEKIETIVTIWKSNGNSYSDSLIVTLKNYGYTPTTFTRKYWRYLLGK